MSKTVLIGDDPVQMDLFALNLKAYVGTETTILHSAEKFKLFLELDQSIDLIITYDKVGTEYTAKLVSEMLRLKHLEIPLCILGEDCAGVKNEKCFPRNVDIKQIIQTVARIFDVTAKDMIKQAVGDFYPIPINFFSRLDESVCDVFLRFNTVDGAYQYVCKFRPGSELDHKLITEYQKKGVSNLYIPSISRLKFTNDVSSKTINILKSPSANPSERISVASTAMQLMADELESVGLTENTAELAQNCISSITQTIADYPKLSNLLQRLLNSPESWLYKYCQILAYVCHYIIDHSDWGSDEQKEKISFVVFFQDIAFMTKKLKAEKLAPIHNKQEFMNAPLEKLESNVVLQHALMASDLVREFSRAPMEADAIIRQHHGSYNGVGFPDAMAVKIAHLAQVLIMAQDFTREVMKINHVSEFAPDVIVNQMRTRYRSHRLQKIIEPLVGLKF